MKKENLYFLQALKKGVAKKWGNRKNFPKFSSDIEAELDDFYERGDQMILIKIDPKITIWTKNQCLRNETSREYKYYLYSQKPEEPNFVLRKVWFSKPDLLYSR